MVMSGSLTRLPEKKHHAKEHAEHEAEEPEKDKEVKKQEETSKDKTSSKPKKDLVMKDALDLSSQNKWIPRDHRPMMVLGALTAAAGLTALAALFVAERR